MNDSNDARAHSPNTRTLVIDVHAETQRCPTIPAPSPEIDPSGEDAIPDTERTLGPFAPSNAR